LLFAHVLAMCTLCQAWVIIQLHLDKSLNF
jgi:hypothetical protein